MPVEVPKQRISVVVADDHPSIRENLRYLLNAEPDIDVVAVASDGEDALRKMDDYQPDVLVLDHDMPGLDGLGVILRSRLECPDVAIVLYTSESDGCERALGEGASGCVMKDESPSVLLAAIRGARTQWQIRDLAGAAAGQAPASSRPAPIDAAALADAIARGQISVELQPIVEVGSGLLSRLEVLARWRDLERGWVPPSRFVPLAETNGMMTPLTLTVVRAALKDLARIHAAQDGIRINLNLSVASLLDPTFFDQLCTALADAGCDPAKIGIEITESVLMREPATTAGALGRLRGLGMRIEVDDFGTGYSSLGRLVDLPIDGVKIDRRFVGSMTRDHRSEAIVRACISLSHDLGLEVVAEGVEDRETWELLRALGCDAVQGYFVGAPMPTSDLAPWLSKWRGRGPQTGARARGVRSSTLATDGRSDVLVVDDEPAIVAMMRDVLEEAGFNVLTAANGVEALRTMEHTLPAVVLLDMQMPILDGPAFARVLRERGVNVPIIVMTAGSSAGRWAQELPAAAYLSKPFDIDGLIGVTSRYATRN
jgi:EAL domain-containing protein (putative c-di-GMP-specific phosphodiesterase class I)/DNA-binding response OmpR family regulator